MLRTCWSWSGSTVPAGPSSSSPGRSRPRMRRCWTRAGGWQKKSRRPSIKCRSPAVGKVGPASARSMLNEVSFELPEPAYADFTWVISDEHTPVAAPPLTADQFAARSNDDGVPRSLRINGFTYMRQDATPPGIPQFPPGPLPSSRDQMRSWRTEWQPEVDKLIERLRGFDPESVPSGSWAATLEEQSREYWRVFGAVHRAAVLPAHAVGQRFQELYLKRFGQARHSDGLALLQGIPNASLERAGLLWQASRVLHADPALLEILDRGEALPESASARQLQAAFDGLLQRFGCTSEGFV